MPPKSKFAPRTNRLQANKVFTNRDKPIALFNALRADLPHGEHRILVFYGVGGEGKSSLCKKFQDILKAETPRQAVWGVIDFQEERKRRADLALLDLRRTLSASGNIKFPAFDVAITHYWEKTYPEANIRELLKDVIDGNQDLISSVVDNAREWANLTGVVPPGIGLGIRGLRYLRNKSKAAWTRKANDALRGIELLEPHQLLEKLPFIFATDLQNYLHNAKQPLQPIILIDTFEALWEKRDKKTGLGTTELDAWLRELVAAAPGVLFVVFGRDKLTWDEDHPERWSGYLEHQHLLGGLSQDDADDFLQKIPVQDPAIRQVMIDGSRGSGVDAAGKSHPYYLDLAVDLYLDWLDDGKTPCSDDFGKTPREIVERFLRYRTGEEIETLKLLSVARQFDRELFNDLIEHFRTGYPLTAFAEFCTYSFVQQGSDGHFRLHALMRDSLQHALDDDLRERARCFLFDRYASGLPTQAAEVSIHHEGAFQEAFYHANWLQVEEALSWFFSQVKPFHEAARYSFLTEIYSSVCSLVEQHLGNDHPLLAKMLIDWADLHVELEQYGNAEPIYKQSLNILENALGYKNPDLAGVLESMAKLKHIKEQYAEAKSLYQRCLAIRQQTISDNHPEVVSVLVGLANLYCDQAQYEDAESHLQLCISILEQNFNCQHPEVAAALTNVANLYCDMRRDAEAESLYIRIIQILESVKDSNYLDVASTLNGLAYLYLIQGRYADAEPLLQRSLRILEQALGLEHPKVASVLNYQANLYIKLGRYRDAEFLLQRSLWILEYTFGGEHSRVASTLRQLGYLYKIQGRNEEAELVFDQCFSIRLKMIRSLSIKEIENELVDYWCTLAKTEFIVPLKRFAIEVSKTEPGFMNISLGDIITVLKEPGKAWIETIEWLPSEPVPAFYLNETMLENGFNPYSWTTILVYLQGSPSAIRDGMKQLEDWFDNDDDINHFFGFKESTENCSCTMLIGGLDDLR